MSPCDAKGPARCKRAIELTREAYYEKTIEQSTTSDNQQIVDTSQDLQQTEDDSTHNEISQNDKTESVNEEPCESTKVWSSGKRLKMIVRKMYPENCSCPTLSGSIVTCLALPCKPRDLIGRIFEVDPSLIESCFIVMKRKFLISVYNICSCLNDILGKLDVKLAKTLYLNCEIYPGYIRFRLKSNGINKCLFVARISICQSVRRRVIQPNFVISICKSKLNAVKRSKCSERYYDNNILVRVAEESKELNDTCCSRLDRNVKDAATNMSREETGNRNREAITCTVTKCVSKYLQDLTTFSGNKSCENIAEEICDVTSQIDNLNKRDGKNHKISDSIEINCVNDAEKRGKEIIDSDNSITIMNEEITRTMGDANCVCLSSENLVETNHEMENSFSDKDPHFLQHDRPSDKELNLGDEECNVKTCSITSFVQNFEHDKQLVELNCNRFLDNNIRAIDKRSENGSLNSVKAEIGCNSSCSSSRNVDFIDITVIDNIRALKEPGSQDDLDAMKTGGANHCKSAKISSKNNDSLVVSLQPPRLRVSSKGISVNVSYPPVWLVSGDDGSTSTKTPDRRVEMMDPSTLIVPRKRHKILGNKRVPDETRGFIKPSRSPVSRCGLRLNGNSKSSNISTEEYLRTTSNTSRCCRSMSKFTASDRRAEFENSHNSTRLSKLSVSSSKGFRSITSFAAIKCGATSRKDNGYSVKVPQAILVMTKFRDSIDKSVGRIKRLIHAKLRKILFNNGIKTESSENTRGKTSGKSVRQVYVLLIKENSDSKKFYLHVRLNI